MSPFLTAVLKRAGDSSGSDRGEGNGRGGSDSRHSGGRVAGRHTAAAAAAADAGRDTGGRSSAGVGRDGGRGRGESHSRQAVRLRGLRRVQAGQGRRERRAGEAEGAGGEAQRRRLFRAPSLSCAAAPSPWLPLPLLPPSPPDRISNRGGRGTGPTAAQQPQSRGRLAQSVQVRVGVRRGEAGLGNRTADSEGKTSDCAYRWREGVEDGGPAGWVRRS